MEAPQVDRVSGSSYRARLRARIERAMTITGTLEELCGACDGASPSAILEIARRHNIAPSPVSGKPIVEPVACDEPEPHPLDFDWRFTKQSADDLAVMALRLGGDIACLGTPRVFRALSRRVVASRMLLWDHNPGWLRVFGNRVRRKSVPISPDEVADRELHKFTTVIMDPPWYVNHYKTWLHTACLLLQPGGEIIMPLFGSLLRPRADSQRRDLQRFIAQIGSTSSRIMTVTYETPPFERAVLRSRGIDVGNWRAAEVVRIRVERAPSLPVRLAHKSEWSRFSIGECVVMLRDDCLSADSIQLSAVSPRYGYCLKSISSRSSVRAKVNLWTSRNHIFQVRGYGRLMIFLQNLSVSGEWCVAASQARLSSVELDSLTPLRLALAAPQRNSTGASA
jgi:hypothetical protein